MGARRRFIGLIALGGLALAMLAGTASGGSAGSDPIGYCRPQASSFNPPDVPEGGSAAVDLPGVRERRLAVDGTATRLLESGRRGSPIAVVLLHGSPGSGVDWEDLLPRLGSAANRAIAVDIPGFGHAAEAWGRQPGLDSGVRFLERVLRKLAIRRVHLVAHDIGGPLGLEWAARHPRRLRSATLIDTGLLIGYRHHQLAQITRSPAGEGFWLQINRASFSAGIQDGQSRPLPPEFVNRLYDDLDRETRCAIIALYRSAGEAYINRFARRQARILARWRGRPALVIWGADDPYLPARMAQSQRSGFPRARIRIFEDAGHWPFVDYRVRTRRLVVPFIRRAIGRDGRRAG
jgi:pimeloyl-ACP methyl ester carboxylesterase